MSGPLAEGDTVTYLPFVAELKPGNRTHNVRLDIVAQEIEIAPEVRFQAWTFGGSVPGPVIHVREGDRINFTLRNRSSDRVSVTQPDKSDAPFLQQLAAANQQKAVPLIAPMHHSIGTSGTGPASRCTSWSTTSLRPTTSRCATSCRGSSRWPRKSCGCTARRRLTWVGSRHC